MKVLVIVPAYNEQSNISNVITSLHADFPQGDILVVNDCSTDRTSEAAREMGRARVIDLPCNLGIGGAVQTGFKYARLQGYDVALQFDGDGQHLASEIAKLIAPLAAGEADVVIGSRFHKGASEFRSTFARRVGIRIFSGLNSLLIGRRITDNTSGFRAYNRQALSFLADDYPSDYPEPEAVVLLGRNGFRMQEVAVQMRERQGGQSSIRGIVALHYMLKVLLSIFMGAMRARVRRD